MVIKKRTVITWMLNPENDKGFRAEFQFESLIYYRNERGRLHLLESLLKFTIL